MSTAPSADVLYFYATSSGGQTLDQDDQGGNPFATALVEVLKGPKIPLIDFGKQLTALTLQHSDGFQRAEIPGELMSRAAIGDGSGIALVAVGVEYYSGLSRLPGALFDANRVARALREAGLQVQVVLDLPAATLTQVIECFGRQSKQHDVAVVYSTGHGVETNGEVRLLTPEFPFDEGRSALIHASVPVTRFGDALGAAKLNAVFFAGCRNDPFRP